MSVPNIKNRVGMSVSGTPGTGPLTLGNAILDALNGDYVSFADAFGADAVTDVFYQDGHNFSVERGVTFNYATGTITRGTVESTWDGSTLSTSALSLTSAARVFVTHTAYSIPVFTRASNELVNGLTGPDNNRIPLPNRPRKLAFFGDSITLSSGQSLLIGYRISTTVNGFTSTNWAILWADPETPSGVGAWTYDSTTKLATWTPYGASAGASVDVSKSGVFYLPGPTDGTGITIVWDGENTTYASGTTDVTVPANGLQYQRMYTTRGYPAAVMMKAGPAWDMADTDAYEYGFALGGIPGMSSTILADTVWQTNSILSDIDVVCIGTNDIAAGFAASTIITAIQSFVLSRIATGSSEVLLLTIPPRDANTATMDKVRAQVNRWIKDYAKATQRVTCIDINAAVCDPANNNWVTGYSTDGIHPTTKGAFAIASMVCARLAEISGSATGYYPDYGDLWDATNNPYGSLIPAAGYNSFEGTGGSAGAGASGDIPANYTLARQSGSNLTLVGSKVARSDGIAGTWYQIELANATGNEYGRLYPQTNAQSLSTYGLTAGDEIEFCLECDVTASTDLLYLNAIISWSSVSARTLETSSDAIHGPTVFPDNAGKLWLRLPPGSKVPLGATGFTVTFRFGTAAGGTATIRLGRWSMSKKRTI